MLVLSNTSQESQTLRWKNATFILIRKICSKCWSSSLSNKNWCPQILYLPAARLGNIQNLRTIIFVVNNFPKQDFDSCSIKCLLFHRCPSIIKFRCQLNLCLGPTFLPDQAKIAKLLIDWAISLGFSRLLGSTWRLEANKSNRPLKEGPIASCAVKMDMWGGPNGLLSSEERSLFPQLVIIMLWYLPHIACTACPRRRVPHRKRIKTVAPWQLVDIYCAWVPEQTAFAMQCCNSEVHTHFTPIFSHFLSQNSRSERKPQILNT